MNYHLEKFAQNFFQKICISYIRLNFGFHLSKINLVADKEYFLSFSNFFMTLKERLVSIVSTSQVCLERQFSDGLINKNVLIYR
jgi:hypothetical protein